MGHVMRRVAVAIVLAWGGVSGARAAPDIPYYKLDYRQLDETYEKSEANARHFVYFYWDGKPYCRYRSGWNGPGAYEVGTRLRRGHGWVGGYPWQGPGQPADHEDAEAYAEALADYPREFPGTCAPRHHVRRYVHRHRTPVLRRKD